MAKDSLLSEKLFSSFFSDEDLRKSAQQEETEILNLVKQSLYSQEEEPIYYQGRHNDFKEFNDFISQPQYIELQKQLNLIIEQLKTWGRKQSLSHLEKTLEDFSIKLKLTGSTEKLTLLYGDGKKSLEIIAVLLDEPRIDLELRKTIFLDLLADNELAKCIDGCYTRIVTTAQKLLEQRESKNQINRWIRNYTTDKARKIAAKRPLAMPESYQSLICRVLAIPVRANELHASNYLLNQAKEKGFAINIIPDLGALEIGHQLDYLNRKEVVDLYLTHLESKITASDLVEFISTRLHDDFKQIMSDTNRDYIEKIAAIETKLQILGRDNGFSLNEIFEEDFPTLKPASALTITVQIRLTHRKWLYEVKRKNFELDSKRFFYYHFPRNLELNWYFQEGDSSRFRFINLLNTDDSSNSINALKAFILFKFLELPDFITHSRDIASLLKHSTLPFPIIDFLPENQLIDCLVRNTDPLRFSQIINSLSLEKSKSIFSKINKVSIQAVITKAMALADVESRFHYLHSDYFIQHYNQAAQEDVLKLTKHLLVNLIEKSFRDFSDYLVFKDLRHTHYLTDIDFSSCDLSNAAFLQSVFRCSFDRCKLSNTLFQKTLEDISFMGVDLQKTIFSGGNDFKYKNINLRGAKLSTLVFQDLLNAGVTSFSYTELVSVEFKRILQGKKLALDLSYADLNNVDLSELDLSNIKFFYSDLSYTNLARSIINPIHSQGVKLQGSHLSLVMVYDLYEQGINRFDECQIYSTVVEDRPLSITLKRISFKRTKFIGSIKGLNLLECDLTEAYFLSPIYKVYSSLVEIDFQSTKFIKTKFYNIRFKKVQLIDCVIQDINFEDVKLSASVLFQFYKLGHRDFNQVKELSGPVPEKLLPFPLSEAALSKEAFIHLYKQGVRDFRASNLNSFYLGEILREQAISSIRLKLGGAHYKRSILSCINRSSQLKKRSPRSSHSYCEFHFLIQKPGTAESVLHLNDIRQLIEENRLHYLNFVLEELVLEQKPLFLLKNPHKISFYWGYIPDDAYFSQLINLTRSSTRILDRTHSQIQFYFTTRISSSENIKTFARRLVTLGFRYGQINYYNLQGRLLALDLQGKSIVLTHYSSIDEKLATIAQAEKNMPARYLFHEKKELSRWYRIAADMKRRSKDMLRSGIRQGAHYEIGYVVMYFVASWLAQKNTPQPQLLDIETRERLKQFAKEIIKKEGDAKRASQYVRNLIERVVVQCIERGECYDEALTQADIVNNLNEIKPDIQVGYEVMWQNVKGFFADIANFFTDNYDTMQGYFLGKGMRYLKRSVTEEGNWLWGNSTFIQAENVTDAGEMVSVFSNISTNEFSAQSNVCLSNQPSFATGETGTIKTVNFNATTVMPATNTQSVESFFYFGNVTRRVSRRVSHWSDNPLIVRMIKTIVICFNEMGFELDHDTQFSEAELACLLYDIGLVLDKCAIPHTSPNDMLTLFQNAYFWQAVLNRSETYDFAIPLTQSAFIESPGNESLEASGNISEVTNLGLIKKKERRHAQYFEIGTMKRVINSQSSSAGRPTFWLTSWMSSLSRTIFSVKEIFSSSISSYSYLKFPFSDKVNAYPEIKQLNNDQGLVQIFFSRLETNNWLILVDYFLKFYLSQQSLKKEKLIKNKHLIKTIKTIIKIAAGENNIRLSDVYNPYFLEELQASPSYYNQNQSVKETIFIVRNKLCQWMDIKQITSVKKFIFLTRFDLAVKDDLIQKKIFYPTDFHFFKKNRDKNDFLITNFSKYFSIF